MTEVITHADVVDTLIGAQYGNNPKAAQEFRSNCKRWCLTLGSFLQAPAEDTLGDVFEVKLAQYQEHLSRTRPGQATAGKNVRTAAAKLRATYVAMLASRELPPDFTGAFRQAMDAKGYTPNILNRLLQEQYFRAENPRWNGTQLWGFYNGTAGPGKCWKGDSKLLLARCEELLGLSANALVSRAYRIVTPVLLGAPTGIPYRIARSRQWPFRYALNALPTRISRIFESYAEWRAKRHFVIDGEIVAAEDRSIWERTATRELYRTNLRRFFGWLCLPAPTKPLAELTEEERWSTGKGMQPKDLRMAHLINMPLALEFVEFMRFRQHNHAFTKTHLMFLYGINSLVSMPYSFLPNHPEHAEEFGLPKPVSMTEWRKDLEKLHKQILRTMRVVENALSGSQRSPDDPLRHVISHEDPFNLFVEMVDRFEQAPPLKANVFRWAKWARDVALFRMQIDVPLRARNLVELILNRHLNRNATTGRWSIFIPLAELKNHYSGAAQDIDRVYSDVASKAIDRYVNEARGRMVGADESFVFFLGPAAGRRANADFVAAAGFKISTDSIYLAIRAALTTYFGQGQGITIFRHITATAILKDDPTQIELAAAELNDSPDTVRTNYSHLVQKDKLRLSARWRQEKERDRRGDAPEPRRD